MRGRGGEETVCCVSFFFGEMYGRLRVQRIFVEDGEEPERKRGKGRGAGEGVHRITKNSSYC